MGRILESLRKAQPRVKATPPTSPTLSAVPVDLPAEETESDQEVSFVEVGPNRSFEASPDVLASLPRNTLPIFEASKKNGEPVHPVNTSSVEKINQPTLIPPEKPAKTHGGLAPELITFHQPKNQKSQQYRELLQAILHPQKLNNAKVFLFTGARPECGTTTVLLNMAVLAAQEENLRVVVVDGNQRRPGIASRLGLSDTVGIRDVLAGKVSLQSAIQETDQSKLFALTAGTPGVNTGIRLVAETVRSLLRQLRSRFDLILVDGPRWDGQADVLLLGAACDGIYLVASESEAESPQIDELYQSIPGHGFNLAGCILAGC